MSWSNWGYNGFISYLLFAKETGTGRAVGHSEECDKDLCKGKGREVRMDNTISFK